MSVLEIPTKERLSEYWDKRYVGPRQRYKTHDRALIIVFGEPYRANDVDAYVAIKVTTLNAFYSTHIQDTNPISAGIFAHGKQIDEYIAAGDIRAVDIIRRAERGRAKQPRDNYSFATKYCYFSNPSAYSIYDKYVALLLADYVVENRWYEHETVAHLYAGHRRQISRHRIQADLKNYEIFMKYIDIFMDAVGCRDRRLIDNFLWIRGKEVHPS